MNGELIDAIRGSAHLLGGGKRDYDPLLRMAADARLVLLGEPTHGSHDIYRERARITQRLISELGFTGVVWEADWPDAERAGRWAQAEEDGDAAAALAGFERFPTWMWRNTAVVEFLRWLRRWNESLPGGAPRAGVYGMDLYGLYRSVQAVIRYLDEVDPAAAAHARERYACFDHHGGDAQAYGYAARLGLSPDCERAAVEQLEELRRRAAGDGNDAFSAEQNARLARNAEQYYRSLFGSRISSWNLRDRHMAEMLEALLEHLSRRDGDDARLVVWAHNSHLGDARATEMGEEGELNVGELVRERFGSEALLVGFTTYEGTVTAAHEWDGGAERMLVSPALPGTVEALFHEVALPRFFLPLRDPGEALGALREARLQRAVGVIYRPATERVSHYFHARIAEQFDAVVHLDRTRAVEPLQPAAGRREPELPETYPSAL